MNIKDLKVTAVENVNRRQIMDSILEKLKTLFPAKEFIVTGSYVLSKYGLMYADDVYDLDIILVQPSPETLENVKNLMRDFPAQKIPKDTSFCVGIFMYDGIKVDVFVENDFSEPTLNIDGIKHTIIPHIIKAKKTYGRMKDWLQCRDMARIFFTSEDFTTQLNNNWKSLLRMDY